MTSADEKKRFVPSGLGDEDGQHDEEVVGRELRPTVVQGRRRKNDARKSQPDHRPGDDVT